MHQYQDGGRPETGRIVVITDDAIFPSNSGGRQELLGECRGLISAGSSISLVVSHRLEMDSDAEAAHKALTPEVTFIRRKGFLRSLIRHPLTPYQIASRVLPREPVIDPGSKEPITAVIASHEWTIPMAREIARRCGVPLILRSHNDELSYMAALAKNANGLKRLYFLAEKWRLSLNLSRLLRHVDAVAILSEGDRKIYETYGVQTHYIPPVLTSGPVSDATSSSSGAPSNDLLFVGALDMPQTAAGLMWFCKEVLPRIRAVLPGVCLHIAGRRAPARLSRYLESVPGVEYHGEVADVKPLYRIARVFINPVFEGSGVNMKVGPPSERGIPTVTSTIGARGLDGLMEGLEVADDSEGFAESCVQLLTNQVLWAAKSKAVKRGTENYTALAVGARLLDVVHQCGSQMSAR